MKKTTKLIAILTVVALLTGLVALAVADDKIYTSPSFKIPKSRISEPLYPENVEEGEPETEPEGTDGTEAVPEDGEPAEETEPAIEDGEPGEETEPATENGEPAEETEPVTEDGEPAEETEPVTEDGEPGEEAEPVTEDGEPAEGTEPEQTGSEEGTEPESEPEPEHREVKIYSSRKDVVTEGDIIELSSILIGFDDVEVTYQWQVDRGDGAGWQNVEGANRWYYKFIANKETILYNWRLIVTAEE